MVVLAQCLHFSGHVLVDRAITGVICSPDHQKLTYPFVRVSVLSHEFSEPLSELELQDSDPLFTSDLTAKP